MHSKSCMKLACSQLAKLLLEKESEDKLIYSYSQLTKISKYQTERVTIVEPIQYLPFLNKEGTWLALVDGGSQANLLDEKILKQFAFTIIDTPNFQLSGISEQTVPVKERAKIVVELPDEKKIEITVAVVPQLACGIILGMPFLCQVGAKQDFMNQKLYTDLGEMQLVTQKNFMNKGEIIGSYITEVGEPEDIEEVLEKDR